MLAAIIVALFLLLVLGMVAVPIVFIETYDSSRLGRRFLLYHNRYGLGKDIEPMKSSTFRFPVFREIENDVANDKIKGDSYRYKLVDTKTGEVVFDITS